MTPEDRRKNLLIKKITRQKIVYEQLLDGLKAYREIIPSFDGKFADRRLEKAIHKVYLNPYKLIFSRKYGNFKVENSNGSFHVSGSLHNYVDFNTCIFKCEENGNGRLNAAKTLICLEKAIIQMQFSIWECQKSLETMDEEYTAWCLLENMVKQYERNFPGLIRGIIDMNR